MVRYTSLAWLQIPLLGAALSVASISHSLGQEPSAHPAQTQPKPAAPVVAAEQPVRLAGILLVTTSAKSGQAISLKIVLTRLAPASGVSVSLVSSDLRLVPVPKSILVPAGVRSLGLTIPTGMTNKEASVTLTGSISGQTDLPVARRVRQAHIVIHP